MQEPKSLNSRNTFSLAQSLPQGIVIEQEAVAPHRVKVRVAGLHTGVDDSDLPWMRVLQGNGIGGGSGGTGTFGTLALGTHVIVLLYDDAGYHGVVLGWLADTASDQQGTQAHGWIDTHGNRFSVTAANAASFTHASGTKINIAPDGSITIDAPTMLFRATNFTIGCTNFTLSAQNPVIIDGNGGGGMTPTLTPPPVPTVTDVANQKDL